MSAQQLKKTLASTVSFLVVAIGYIWLLLALLWMATSPFAWFFRLTGLLP